MAKVDFQVLSLQLGGGRKIPEFVINGRGCLVLLKSVLAGAVF